MKQAIFRFIYIFILLAGAAAASAQSLEQAKKWFAAGKYAEAKPVFEKLVKQAPNNASYNYWYGACAYETNDPATAETYLTTAISRRLTEAYPTLGELYMKEYRFGDALKTYNEYIEALVKQKKYVEPFFYRQVELAEKAQRMVDRVEDIQVIDSAVVDKSAFLSTYKLSEEAGSLAMFTTFFRTDEQVQSTVYMNELGDKIYYAHPTADNAHYSLYTQARPTDKWDDEKRLPDNINLPEANTNYPFAMPDGLTIYYASDGSGSIGGYDIFVTRYNINTDQYLTPEQLGMPFNSPANDYMLVIDEVKNLGWFASDRNQPDDKVCLYLFIPDPQRNRVEEDNPALKRSRAMLTSISDTWKANNNYVNLVAKGRTPIPKQKARKKDFEFIINNNVTYYTLDEIKSPEARTLYEKYLKANETIASLEHRLSDLRATYRKSAAARKDELKPTILQAESQLYDLQAQPTELEKKARNAEITYLSKNNR
jgi:tetratricopeptide (TPR) repeat protein